MKKLFFIIALALSLVGCSEKYYFEWTDKDAIAPISSDSESGSDLFSDSDAAYGIAMELLKQNGIYFESSFSITVDDPQAEAIIINDQQVIADVVKQLGFETKISGIETDKFSLVAGYVVTAQTGKYIISQRAKQTSEGVSMRIVVEEDPRYGAYCTQSRWYYLGLYDTDLPSGPVDKIYCTYK
jgi:hypothetical protein